MNGKKADPSGADVRGYNLGQPDTGAALGLAQQILEQQAGQNNMVLLFTDGAIRATRNGRTNEISEQEVDAFAAFAQTTALWSTRWVCSTSRQMQRTWKRQKKSFPFCAARRAACISVWTTRRTFLIL